MCADFPGPLPAGAAVTCLNVLQSGCMCKWCTWELLEAINWGAISIDASNVSIFASVLKVLVTVLLLGMSQALYIILGECSLILKLYKLWGQIYSSPNSTAQDCVHLCQWCLTPRLQTEFGAWACIIWPTGAPHRSENVATGKQWLRYLLWLPEPWIWMTQIFVLDPAGMQDWSMVSQLSGCFMAGSSTWG